MELCVAKKERKNKNNNKLAEEVKLYLFLAQNIQDCPLLKWVWWMLKQFSFHWEKGSIVNVFLFCIEVHLKWKKQMEMEMRRMMIHSFGVLRLQFLERWWLFHLHHCKSAFHLQKSWTSFQSLVFHFVPVVVKGIQIPSHQGVQLLHWCPLLILISVLMCDLKKKVIVKKKFQRKAHTWFHSFSWLCWSSSCYVSSIFAWGHWIEVLFIIQNKWKLLFIL